MRCTTGAAFAGNTDVDGNCRAVIAIIFDQAAYARSRSGCDSGNEVHSSATRF
jgi:hypothetical protein